MIFPLHFEKASIIVLNTLFPISFLILIYHPPFIHIFLLELMLGFQECIRSTVYFRLESGDAGGDDGLRAEGDLGVDHTFTREENHWVRMGLYS